MFIEGVWSSTNVLVRGVLHIAMYRARPKLIERAS